MGSRTDTLAVRATIIHLNDTPERLRSGLREALSSSSSPNCTGAGISLWSCHSATKSWASDILGEGHTEDDATKLKF